jgi:hypothetical protein
VRYGLYACFAILFFATNDTHVQESKYINYYGNKHEAFNEMLKDAHVFHCSFNGRYSYFINSLSYTYSFVKEILRVDIGNNQFENYDYKTRIINQIKYHIPKGEKIIVLKMALDESKYFTDTEYSDFVSMLDNEGFEIRVLDRSRIGPESMYFVHEIKPKTTDFPHPSNSRDIYQYLDIIKNDISTEKRYSIFIGVKDEAAKFLYNDILTRLSALGLQSSLQAQFNHPYLAVIDKGEVTYEVLGEDPGIPLSYSGILSDGTEYDVFSKGTWPSPENIWLPGACSIKINGHEYAPNGRGMNFVIYDNIEKQVIDSVSFDTWTQELTPWRIYF